MQPSYLKEHLRVIAPNWPLQNIVAVNPFWNQIDRPFDEVMAKMAALLHQSLYMPLPYYLQKYHDGEITDQDLKAAAASIQADRTSAAFNLNDFVRACSEIDSAAQECHSFSDFLDHSTGSAWHSFVTYEVAKCVSAFFDEGQAMAKFPWSDLSFYEAWFAAQEFDRSFAKSGIKDFHEVIREFQSLQPEVAIQKIVSRLGFVNEQALTRYVGRLSVLNNGWASQFSYNEWQAGLNGLSSSKTKSIDLVAVQMIIDYSLAVSFEKSNPGITELWIHSFLTDSLEKAGGPRPFDLNWVWQTALERSRQREVAALIRPCEESPTLPKIQIAMCLDVRSETLRRSLEAVSDEIETIGFAGFFGLPFEYKKIDEKAPGLRAPVLLKAGFTVQEQIRGRSPIPKIATTVARSYFRNLRKAPMSSFLFVELFSLPAMSEMTQLFLNSIRPWGFKKLPKKFTDGKTGPSPSLVLLANNKAMSLQTKVKTAATVLTRMGLHSRLGQLVVFAGHGSHNTNNAFNSASECGACGGHSGDVNGRFLADLLNDPEVRQGLKEHSIDIPSTTHFIGAIHETVTDQIYLLDEARFPESLKTELPLLVSAIQKAGEATRKERQFARSTSLDPSPWRRARNWADVRPEWALAGNSCFIVAPRRFTKHSDLAGRAFLHDYEWRSDKNFETLELIMTAPMLVTNWINMQYYASTVAPGIYGSGNKVLHNLVNETGVVEGNGGDLRIGLPWQSVSDGSKFVHEPVRLAVYIAAPVEEIEKIIAKHEVVKNLVKNEWLSIFHIDDENGGNNLRIL